MVVVVSSVDQPDAVAQVSYLHLRINRQPAIVDLKSSFGVSTINRSLQMNSRYSPSCFSFARRHNY